MGQKVNPHGLRVGVIKDWDSRWYANKADFGDTLVEDYNVRNYIKKSLYAAGVPRIEIERFADKVRIHIHCAKPGIVIGRGGAEIEKLRVKLEAMMLFSVTQLSYCARLVVSDENKKRQRVQILCHVVLSVAMIVITRLVLGKGCDPVAVVSMFYYANLILNIVFSFIRFKKLYIFAIGLLLFAGCDTVIGLSLLKDFVSISQDSIIYKIIYPGFDLVWAFYIPSQVLLGMSLVPEKIKKLKNKE